MTKASYPKSIFLISALILSSIVYSSASASATALGSTTSSEVTISGTVVATSPNGDRVPLEGISIFPSIAVANKSYPSGLTDSNGNYTLKVPYSAQVRITAVMRNHLFDGSFQYVSERAPYNQLEQSSTGIWFHGEPVISVLNVSPGATLLQATDIEFPRAEGYGTISGNLKSTSGSALKVLSTDSNFVSEPAQDAVVNVYDSEGTLQSQVQAKEGSYAVAEMPGTYYLSIGDAVLNVKKQFYGAATDLADSTPVLVVANKTSTGIDFESDAPILFRGFSLRAGFIADDAIVGHKVSVPVESPIEPGSKLTVVWSHMSCQDMSMFSYEECTYEVIQGSEKTIDNPTANTNFSYVFKSSDTGYVVAASVTLSKSGFVSQKAYASTLRVLAPTTVVSSPKIKGTVKVGQTLTAVLPKFKVFKPTYYEYMWLACGSALKAKTAGPETCDGVSDMSSNPPGKITLPKTARGKYLVLQIWSHDSAAFTRIITSSTTSKVK